jgi:hypothetical protein
MSAKKKSFSAHSLNGPSSFARRRACNASMQMEMGLPNESTFYAAEGTAAHTLGEKCLKTGKNTIDFLGQKMGQFTHKDGKIEEFIVDGEMVENVQIYVDYCRAKLNKNSIIETKLNLPFLGPDETTSTGYVRGTADFITLYENILEVVDLKYGKGYMVDVLENVQGLCYGMGAVERFLRHNWDTLRITIIQPRAFGGGIKSWDVKREDLLDWKMDFASAAMNTFLKNPDLNPSKECQFCKALFMCKGIVKLIEEITGMDLTKSSTNPIDIHKLKDEQIVDIIFNKLPIIKKWFSELEDYALRRAQQNNPLPGTKIVSTRGTRSWKNEVQAEKFFAKVEGAYTKKFISAPQMEKLLGKKKFAECEQKFKAQGFELVTKNSTGITLVPISDSRPNAKKSGIEDFGNIY